MQRIFTFHKGEVSDIQPQSQDNHLQASLLYFLLEYKYPAQLLKPFIFLFEYPLDPHHAHRVKENGMLSEDNISERFPSFLKEKESGESIKVIPARQSELVEPVSHSPVSGFLVSVYFQQIF